MNPQKHPEKADQGHDSSTYKGEIAVVDDLQPSPIANDGAAIWDLVIGDMERRDRVGQLRYGTRLQANNGRDMLRDAYEEALDLCVYLRGAIAERDQKK